MNEKLFIIHLILAKLIIIKAEKEELVKLEEEKAEILKQIDKAIDESIVAFKKINDSKSATAISYMKDLKQQIKDVNQTEDIEIALKDETSKEVRRSLKDMKSNNKIRLSIVDIANIFSKKPSKTKEEREMNQVVMQKKINEWIKQRELEREKIMLYKQKQHAMMKIRYEKCPRFGKGERKKKNTFRRTAQGNGRPKYPCCRKCCKKSYLGCL